MRRLLILLAAIPFAGLGTSGIAFAQSGCQPTITQPCTKAPAEKSGIQSQRQTLGAQSNDTDEPKDHTPRIRLNRNTDFKFGTGGIGIGQKF